MEEREEEKTVREDRSNWVIRKCESFEEMEKLQLADWQSVSGRDRFAAAWQMVLDAWELKKRNPDKLRFQRLVTVVRRPGS